VEIAGAAGLAAFIAGCGGEDEPTATSRGSQSASLPKTPACDDGHTTPPQTAGPFFKPESPERQKVFETGVTVGVKLVLAGRVLSTDCRPVRRALLDFWQADGDGKYDNEGFALRGHQFTDGNGHYGLGTVVPGLYPGRTRHIHVRVQPPGGSLLTTQLYLPSEPANEADSLFDERLLVSERGRHANRPEELGLAKFDFVVEA
jgi:protocatechuate 3,4-dioxygenase beta subunit